MTVYYGDKVTINGQTYELLTMYGNPPTGPNVCITLPVVNGRIVEAFPGFATAMEWLHNPNQFDLSFDEIPCFTRGTLISTATGSASVEDLSIGDLVLTKDNGLKPIRWIGSRKLDVVDLRSSPNLRPIRIRAGALGGDSPEQDLIVSPQHRVLVCSRIAQNRFGSHEVLVAAKQLLAIEGIEVAEDVSEVEYWHFMFDAHEVVFSNGAETESLYTGAQALKSVGTKVRKEIFTIFPELEHLDVDEHPQGARPFLTGREGRTLAQLHGQKNRALLAQF